MDKVSLWENWLEAVTCHNQYNKILRSLFDGIGLLHYNAPLNAPDKIEERDKSLPKADHLLLMPNGNWIVVRSFMSGGAITLERDICYEIKDSLRYFDGYLDRKVEGFCLITHQQNFHLSFSLEEISRDELGTVFSSKSLLKIASFIHDRGWSEERGAQCFESLLTGEVRIHLKDVPLTF